MFLCHACLCFYDCRLCGTNIEIYITAVVIRLNDISFRYKSYDFVYRNEKDVGQGIKKSGIPRSEVFVVTKLWGDDHGPERCKEGFAKSLRKYAVGLFLEFYHLFQYPARINIYCSSVTFLDNADY